MQDTINRAEELETDRMADLRDAAAEEIRAEAIAVAGPEPNDRRIRADGSGDESHASVVNEQLSEAEKTEEYDPLYVGDHVQDKTDPDATMLVANLDTLSADAYELEDGLTVADVNTEYPANQDVVEVVYPQRTDLTLEEKDRYAFPRSRLELVESIHDRGGNNEGETDE